MLCELVCHLSSRCRYGWGRIASPQYPLPIENYSAKMGLDIHRYHDYQSPPLTGYFEETIQYSPAVEGFDDAMERSDGMLVVYGPDGVE
jgi:hypothetical protein